MKLFQTKRDMVYSQIKENILSGQLRPGDRLHIGSLARDFSISEIPIREAIQVLESEKLVQIIPHTGAIVAPVSSSDLDDILELRHHLEPLATYLATPFLTDDDLAAIEKNMKKQAFVIECNDLHEFGQLNLEFHQLIYQRNPNKRLNDIILNLLDHSKRYRVVFQNNLEFTKGSYAEHQQIFLALQKKDAQLAQQLMQKHKIRSATEIKAIWSISDDM